MFYGKTEIKTCIDALDLGAKAAEAVAEDIHAYLQDNQYISIILAAGESQKTFLDALANIKGIEWDRVICFNLDDFWDPRLQDKYSCGYQTRKQLYDKVNPKEVHLVNYNAMDPEQEAERFEELMKKHAPFHIVCQGIGTSGHLALNEPGATDFNDQRWVRVVDVAEQSKKQLMQDPNFMENGYIPDKGITMTIPALMSGTKIYNMVPYGLKKDIMTNLINTDKATESLPASILYDYQSIIYVDQDSVPDF